MKKISIAIALIGAALAPPAFAQTPPTPPPPPAPLPQTGYTNAAPEWTTIHMERMVDRPAAVVWAKVGGYCQIELWLGTKCVLTAGNGGIGTNRQLNGSTNEIMVAKSPMSYGYSQPLSPIYYHGNLSVEVVDATHSKIVYDLFYDVGNMKTPEAKTTDVARRKQRFEAGIDKMVALAHQP
jgi:hypothetical protein